MEDKILAGIIRYRQADKYPPDLVQSYSGAFRTAMNLYRKVQDDIDTPQDLLLALQSRKGAMPDTTYEKTEELVKLACLAQPATGEFIREDYLAGRLNTILARYLAGEDVIIEQEVEKVLSLLPVPGEDEIDNTTDLAEIIKLKNAVGGSGIELPLPGIRSRIRPLVPGDLMILGALPGRGKTSLSAYLLCSALPKDSPSKLLWLNNEGGSPGIRLRCVTALTGLTEEQIAARPDEAQVACDKALGKAEIRVQGIHGKTWRQVQDIIKAEKPTICVLDMIDHIKGPSRDRRDLELEYLYQDARQLGVELGCVMVATTQLSNPPKEADPKFPTAAWFKDSKSGKEGAGTFILLMGEDPAEPNLRYLAVAKTKSPKPGVNWRTPWAVGFNEQTCVFKDVT